MIYVLVVLTQLGLFGGQAMYQEQVGSREACAAYAAKVDEAMADIPHLTQCVPVANDVTGDK